MYTHIISAITNKQYKYSIFNVNFSLAKYWHIKNKDVYKKLQILKVIYYL